MMGYCDEKTAREQIVEFGRRLYERGMVAANDGNLSVRLGEDLVLATPTGVSKGYLTAEQAVLVNMAGERLSGELPPSSELLMHLRVYREDPAVRAVVHAHSACATAFAAAGLALDKPLLTEAVMALGEVPLAPFATPGTPEVAESVAPLVAGHVGLLLANHGALAWGESLEAAYFRLESIEHTAKIRLLTEFVIGSSAELTQEQLARLTALKSVLE